MNGAHQLRYHTRSLLGSMWGGGLHKDSIASVEAVLRVSGGSPRLMDLDVEAAAVTGPRSVIVHDTYFSFIDGEFAVLGRNQRDYLHVQAEEADGGVVRLALRDPDGSLVSDQLALTDLARLPRSFVDSVLAGDLDLPEGNDWYLIPIPPNMTPIVLEGKRGSYLVNGIDFIARKSFLAMRSNPADVLTPGRVMVRTAAIGLPRPYSYVTGSHATQHTGRYISEYTRKSQSLHNFKLAAAEFSGMHVLQEDDVIMSRHAVPGGMLYVMAASGVVEVLYPHDTPPVGEVIKAGYIFANDFNAITAVDISGTFLDVDHVAPGVRVRLDGILPVRGLTWTIGQRVFVDYAEISPGGTPHTRLHFDGSLENLEKLWNIQKRHELQTGVYLYDNILPHGNSRWLDMGSFLASYYGRQVVLFLSSHHSDSISLRLREFIDDYKPVGCVILSNIDEHFPAHALLDEFGNPYRDEEERIIMA